MKKLKKGDTHYDEYMDKECEVLAVAYDDFYNQTVYFLKYEDGFVSTSWHYELENGK